jgi:hypothetical protein
MAHTPDPRRVTAAAGLGAEEAGLFLGCILLPAEALTTESGRT